MKGRAEASLPALDAWPALDARTWGRRALGLATLLAVLAAWELASRTRLLNPQFFPPVTDILGTFWALWANNVFPEHLAATLRRMAVGYVAAVVLGVGLGLVMGRWQAVYDLFEPVVEFARPMPPVARTIALAGKRTGRPVVRQ